MKRHLPKSYEEVEKYIIEKNLAINPRDFWDFFDAGDWNDSKGNPVMNWKQKALTWHKHTVAKEVFHRCSLCSKRGIYVIGHDQINGYPVYRCHDHRPIEKPIVSKETADKMLKPIESEDDTSRINRLRNEQIRNLMRN